MPPSTVARALWILWLVSGEVRVDLETEPGRVVLGDGGTQEVRLTIKLEAAGALAPGCCDVVVHSTAGRVDDVRQVGPTEYAATLKPPDERFPQLAVVSAAEVSSLASGLPPPVDYAVVTYSAHLDLRGHTEPGARTQVRIGSATFGPVDADAKGEFVVPVVVPPGEGWAQGVSTDELGNASRSRINLYLPDVRRVHGFVFPPAVVADGRDQAWVFVTTLGSAGGPEDAALTVSVGRGTIQGPERIRVGLSRLRYTAPIGTGDGSDTITLRPGRRGTKSEILDVPLIAGAPAAVDVQIDPETAPADGRTSPSLTIRVRDGHGSLAPGHRVTVQLNEQVLEAAPIASGGYGLALAPRVTAGRDDLVVTVTPRADPCVRPALLRQGGRWLVLDVRGVACDGAGQLYDARGASIGSFTLSEDGRLVVSDELSAKLVAGARVWLRSAIPQNAVRPGAASLSVARPVITHVPVVWRLPTPVDLKIRELGRKAGKVRLRVDAVGVDKPQGRVRVVATGALQLVVQPGAAGSLEVVFALPEGGVDVVAIDGPTGVSAWLRVE